MIGFAGRRRPKKPRSRQSRLEQFGDVIDEANSNHVLNDWFGHSGANAETHYLQTTEHDFTEAIGGNEGGNKQAKTGESASKAECEKPNKKRPPMPALGTVDRSLYTPEDSNL